jgi:predicted Zn-dependent peptidase
LSVRGDAAYELFENAVAEFKRFTHLAQPVAFSERDLQTAQRGFASEYNFQRDGTAATADIIFTQWKLGLPLADLDNDPKRILSISLSDLNALAQRCQSHAVLSLLGDRARISPRLVAGADGGVASH